MSRFVRAFTAASLCSLATSQVVAAEIVVEAEPVSQRLVLVVPDDFGSSDRREVARKQIRQAARAVCREQYPVQTTYLHSRACYRGTVRDAFDQLRRIETRWASTSSAPPAQIAIFVRPH